MDQNTQPNQPKESPAQQPGEPRPNDSGSFSVEGFLRILDPNTKEVIVEKRA